MIVTFVYHLGVHSQKNIQTASLTFKFIYTCKTRFTQVAGNSIVWQSFMFPQKKPNKNFLWICRCTQFVQLDGSRGVAVTDCLGSLFDFGQTLKLKRGIIPRKINVSEIANVGYTFFCNSHNFHTCIKSQRNHLIV